VERFPAGPDDDAAFAAFRCWDGVTGQPWTEEVENRIRGSLLRQFTNFTFAFREDGELVAVSSFFPHDIGIPLNQPEDVPSWHLDVMAVRFDLQRAGLSQQVLELTFDAMRAEDRERVVVSAYIHHQNTGAIQAATRAGITAFHPRDDDYWVFVGDVAGPP
jgi:RimJ/RimL family protein N-acetyltransferase